MASLERSWDRSRLARAASRPPARFRIEPYVGHGGAHGVVVRGRVLDDPHPSEAVEDEGLLPPYAARCGASRPTSCPAYLCGSSVAGTSAETLTDDEGYFRRPARARPAR